MRRIVYKYGTGDQIPEGARHVATIAQTRVKTDDREFTDLSGPLAGQTYTRPGEWIDCFLVWHYYEVTT